MKMILVIRSGSLKHLLPVLSYLKKNFPESRIHLLTDPDISQTVSQNPFADEVILYRNLRTFFRHQLWQFWGQKYNIKVALFTGEGGARYSKFKVLAHLLPPLHWMLAFNENEDYFSWPTDWRKALAHLWWRAKGPHRLPKIRDSFLLHLVLFPLAAVLLLLSVGSLLCKRLYYSRRPYQTRGEGVAD